MKCLISPKDQVFPSTFHPLGSSFLSVCVSVCPTFATFDHHHRSFLFCSPKNCIIKKELEMDRERVVWGGEGHLRIFFYSFHVRAIERRKKYHKRIPLSFFLLAIWFYFSFKINEAENSTLIRKSFDLFFIDI